MKKNTVKQYKNYIPALYNVYLVLSLYVPALIRNGANITLLHNFT